MRTIACRALRLVTRRRIVSRLRRRKVSLLRFDEHELRPTKERLSLLEGVVRDLLEDSMWRYFACAIAAVALGGCVDCDHDSVYACETHYSLRYGYYDDCHPVHGWCRDTYHHGSQYTVPCTRDADCTSGRVCSAGVCMTSAGAGGAPSGAGGASEPDGSAAGGALGGSAGASGSDPGTSMGAGPNGSAGDNGSAGANAAGRGGNVAGSAGTSSSSGGNGSGSNGSGSAGMVSVGGSANGAGGSSASGGPNGRIPRLDFACVRDTQCGAGECTSGLCYLACASDKECGTGDRCSVETGRRICMDDPNPPVRCDESAICTSVQTCVNGSCHDPCNADADCKNLADRCVDHLCFPDRRPIAECVLNVECASGLVCLDGRCVTLAGI